MTLDKCPRLLQSADSELLLLLLQHLNECETTCDRRKSPREDDVCVRVRL